MQNLIGLNKYVKRKKHRNKKQQKSYDAIQPALNLIVFSCNK